MKAYAIICLAAVAASITACSDKKKTPDESVPRINVARAISDSVVIYHSYPGTLKANTVVDLVARVNGTIVSQNYSGGQLVEKGQLLFTIEDTQYRDAVQQAESSLATARSNREYAAAQYDAMSKALRSDAVSQMEVNKAKSALQQAEAAIRTAEAELRTARTNLGYCRVYAPFRGHVTSSALDVGSYVDGAGAPVRLATIYDDATLYADFHVDDKAMQQILLNREKFPVNLDSIPLRFQQDIPQSYFARLTYISPQVDTSTGTLDLHAAVDNTDGDLHDGMYVTISLPAQSDPHAIIVKDAAISSDQLGNYLFTVNDSNKVVYTPVRTGDIVLDSMRVIRSGISPGTPYVTRALLKVRDGMTVSPVFE